MTSVSSSVATQDTLRPDGVVPDAMTWNCSPALVTYRVSPWLAARAKTSSSKAGKAGGIWKFMRWAVVSNPWVYRVLRAGTWNMHCVTLSALRFHAGMTNPTACRPRSRPATEARLERCAKCRPYAGPRAGNGGGLSCDRGQPSGGAPFRSAAQLAPSTRRVRAGVPSGRAPVRGWAVPMA